MDLTEERLTQQFEVADPGQSNVKAKSFREASPTEAKKDRIRPRTQAEIAEIGKFEAPENIDPNWFDKIPVSAGMIMPFSGDSTEVLLQAQLGGGSTQVDPIEAALAAQAGSGSAIPGAAPQSLLGGFTAGVKRGLRNDTALVKGAIGVGLSGLGFESGNEWLDDAIADQQQAEKSQPRAVGSFSEIGGVGDAAMYAAETLGEQRR
jgi:hypothetical protein